MRPTLLPVHPLDPDMRVEDGDFQVAGAKILGDNDDWCTLLTLFTTGVVIIDSHPNLPSDPSGPTKIHKNSKFRLDYIGAVLNYEYEVVE